jgi:hypothetical protein
MYSSIIVKANILHSYPQIVQAKLIVNVVSGISIAHWQPTGHGSSLAERHLEHDAGYLSYNIS